MICLYIIYLCFFTVHQNVCYTRIDIQERLILGYTELYLKPLDDSKFLSLNVGEMSIIDIFYNKKISTLDYNYENPLDKLCSATDSTRSLKDYEEDNGAAILNTEYDCDSGELLVELPEDRIDPAVTNGNFEIKIYFAIRNPIQGFQLVTTGDKLKDYMFTYGHYARSWFPCIDSQSVICTWQLTYNVYRGYNVISSGELEKTGDNGKDENVYGFKLTVPTCASNIGLAIGNFESFFDPISNINYYFCAYGKAIQLKHTIRYTNEMMTFMDDEITKFPFTTYKQIFLDCVDEIYYSYASLTVFSSRLFETNFEVDWHMEMRRILMSAIAAQYFGSYLLFDKWSEVWLKYAIPRYFSGIYIQKIFGDDAYKKFIHNDNYHVTTFEERHGGISLDPSRFTHSKFSLNEIMYPLKDFNMTNDNYNEIMKIKSHLLLRILERKVGRRKLLVALRSNVLISGFTKNLFMTTENLVKHLEDPAKEDITHLLQEWLYKRGHPKFLFTYRYNKTTNSINIEIQQNFIHQKGIRLYIGPLNLWIQEWDGIYTHVINIDKDIVNMDIPCHTFDLENQPLPKLDAETLKSFTATSNDSPILWMKLDPTINTIRTVIMYQPNYQYNYQLRYDNCILAKHMSLVALSIFKSKISEDVILDIIQDENLYYPVRCLAMLSLNKIISRQYGKPVMHLDVINIFRKIMKIDEGRYQLTITTIDEFQHHFCHFILPIIIRNHRTDNFDLREITEFLLNLLNNSDETSKYYLGNFYKSFLLNALKETILPMTRNDDDNLYKIILAVKDVLMKEDVKATDLQNPLTIVGCLKLLKQCDIQGHYIRNNIYKQFTKTDHNIAVRLHAFACMLNSIKAGRNTDEFYSILSTIENNEDPYIRVSVAESVLVCPPFTNNEYHPLNTSHLIERLWKSICVLQNSDPKLRNHLVDIYYKLYGFDNNPYERRPVRPNNGEDSVSGTFCKTSIIDVFDAKVYIIFNKNVEVIYNESRLFQGRNIIKYDIPNLICSNYSTSVDSENTPKSPKDHLMDPFKTKTATVQNISDRPGTSKEPDVVIEPEEPKIIIEPSKLDGLRALVDRYIKSFSQLPKCDVKDMSTLSNLENDRVHNINSMIIEISDSNDDDNKQKSNNDAIYIPNIDSDSSQFT